MFFKSSISSSEVISRVDQLIEISLAMAAFGLACMTVLFPVFAIIIYRITNRKQIRNDSKQFATKIDVLIPAYNEQEGLKKTIESVYRSAAKFSRINLDLNVIVCIDGANTASEKIAESLATKTIVNQINLGKWNCLLKLIEVSRTDCDWVVLADCGSIWEDSFFDKICADLLNENIVAINPAYYCQSNIINKITWLIERKLKQFENLCGGPISLHGACIFYRRICLKQVLDTLHQDSWLHDDIVIPIILRAEFKNLSISYRPDIHVYDQDQSSISQQQKRRNRMVYGNIQWISKLLPMTFSKSPLVGILALRRVFRVFWSYYLALLVLGAFTILTINTNLNFSLIISLLAIFPFILNSNFRAALLASLLSPFYLINISKKTVAWK